jgi:hypothetical protein
MEANIHQLKKILFLILIVIVNSYSPSFAIVPNIEMNDNRGWQKIGHTQVNIEKDRDVIHVKGTKKFTKIKFKVSEPFIVISDVEVYYTSGDMQTLKTNETLKSSEITRYVDLDGERSIKKIVFIYKTLPNKNKNNAEVNLWGYRNNLVKK